MKAKFIAITVALIAWHLPVQAQPKAGHGRQALLIVDMQNDFVRLGAPMEVPDARKTVPNILRLLEFARKAGLPVIYTRFLSTKDSTLLWNWSPKVRPPVNACRPGHLRKFRDTDESLEGADIIGELKPLTGEMIIDKYGYGAFHGTNLDSLLRSLNVETILLTGTVTQICVEETGRQAFHYGYKTIMISDGVSSFMPDLHNATLKNFAMKFGWVKTTDAVLKELTLSLSRK